MIFNALIDWFASFICQAISALSFVTIPVDFITVLATITKYGAWIVGSDLLMLFFAFITAWYVVKFGLGVLEWIWKLLPLT